MESSKLKLYDCLIPRVTQYSYDNLLMCPECKKIRASKDINDPLMSMAMMKETSKYWNKVMLENEVKELT